MRQFYAIVHKDADSAYGVEFPDLPGCFSAADELKEVVPNAIEALSLWFEDERLDVGFTEVVFFVPNSAAQPTSP